MVIRKLKLVLRYIFNFLWQQGRHLDQSKSFRTFQWDLRESSLNGGERSCFHISLSRILPLSPAIWCFPLWIWVLFNCSSEKVGRAEFPRVSLLLSLGTLLLISEDCFLFFTFALVQQQLALGLLHIWMCRALLCQKMHFSALCAIFLELSSSNQ